MAQKQPVHETTEISEISPKKFMDSFAFWSALVRLRNRHQISRLIFTKFK